MDATHPMTTLRHPDYIAAWRALTDAGFKEAVTYGTAARSDWRHPDGRVVTLIGMGFDRSGRHKWWEVREVKPAGV